MSLPNFFPSPGKRDRHPMKAPSRSQMRLGPLQRLVPSCLGASGPPPPHVPPGKRALHALQGASPGEKGRSPNGLPKPIILRKIPYLGKICPCIIRPEYLLVCFFFLPPTTIFQSFAWLSLDFLFRKRHAKNLNLFLLLLRSLHQERFVCNNENSSVFAHPQENNRKSPPNARCPFKPRPTASQSTPFNLISLKQSMNISIKPKMKYEAI